MYVCLCVDAHMETLCVLSHVNKFQKAVNVGKNAGVGKVTFSREFGH